MLDFRIIAKVVITAVLIVAISEIGKKSNLMGALLASLPLTSVLALSWLYFDSRSAEKVSELSMGIFWMVIPSLLFFPVLSYLLRSQWSFVLALLSSSAVTALGYYLFSLALLRFNIRL